MAENLMNSEHKSTNIKFREGYDNIKWFTNNENKECEEEKNYGSDNRKSRNN